MTLSFIDYLIIFVYFVAMLVIGVLYTRRASKNTTEFFVSGRDLNWWLLGTSLVATTFASDTPLAITDLVRTNGIAGNWLWWNFAFAEMMALFFFARLWRRAEIITDAELIELRYHGKPAAALRGISAGFRALVYNTIAMAWVINGMATIWGIISDMPRGIVIPFLIVMTLIYSTMSGMWGVVVTDFVQFGIAMFASLMLMFFAVSDAGGISELVAKLHAMPEKVHLNFLPDGSEGGMPLSVFFMYIGIMWWVTGNAEGGRYTAQRLFAGRDERHSVMGYLWYMVAHYALRTWPWILVALCSIIKITSGTNQAAYPEMMKLLLGPGFRGIMVASFFAAFMSTIVTHLNLGASYLVNDLYQRFVYKEGSARHYVWMSRLGMVFMAVISGYVAYNIQSVVTGWKLFYILLAGTGTVMLLRWYWWRINAWSELAAIAASPLGLLVVILYEPNWATSPKYPLCLLMVAGVSAAVWLPVTLFLTSPEPNERLISFYRKVRPPTGWWGNIPRLAGLEGERKPYAGLRLIGYWLCGVTFIYSALFCIGKFIFGEYGMGSFLLIVMLCTGYITYRALVAETKSAKRVGK